MNLKLKGRIIEKFGSQADFAQNMQIDESYISRVIRGRRTLSHDEQEKWATILGMDRDQLFGASADAGA